MKKKILIFSSYGGGGHVSASMAIQQNLQEQYDIETVYIFDSVLAPLDPFKVFSFGGYSGEHFYNFCLKKKWTGLINIIYFLARNVLYVERGLTKRIVQKYLNQHKPDLVISVVPLINETIKASCDELNMPFLLVPTDLDADSFIYNIKSPGKKMKIAVAFNDGKILEAFNAVGIEKKQIEFANFPIKPNFFEDKNLLSIKEDFNVPSRKKVIMVLMGAAGSDVTLRYVKSLSQLDFPVHLLICLGRNEALRKEVEEVILSKSITMTIIGKTNRVADLMAISDLCITKAGSVSVCEAIYSNIPMILDNTSSALRWEAFNLDFIKAKQFGCVNNNFRNLNHQVKEILTNQEYYDFFKTNLESFPKAPFGPHLKEMVKELV